MKTLSVNVARLDSLSPVWVGSGVIQSAASLIERDNFTRVVVVGDAAAAPIIDTLINVFQINNDDLLILQGGESCKSSEDLLRVWGFFTERRLDRKSLVIGVGGGAISDLVGFAAATFMRGIAFLAVPTTLLAQVDASIGGKSGINFGGAKNILGAIRQPTGIIIDIDALETLSERDRRSGFAEIVKHGLIADPGYFSTVTSHHHSTWTPTELSEIIFRSCEIKRDIVQADETEQGPRKNLNFGHTLGHAVEALALAEGISLTHGEAVAIGMHAATFISMKRGLISQSELEEVCAAITRVGLPIHTPTAMSEQTLRELIELDKKNVKGKTRWTLLHKIGVAIYDQEVDPSLVSEAIRVIQPKG